MSVTSPQLALPAANLSTALYKAAGRAKPADKLQCVVFLSSLCSPHAPPASGNPLDTAMRLGTSDPSEVAGRIASTLSADVAVGSSTPIIVFESTAANLGKVAACLAPTEVIDLAPQGLAKAMEDPSFRRIQPQQSTP